MSFTPLLASWDEVMAFNKTVGREDFRMTQTEWGLAKEIFFPMAEGKVLEYCNQTALTSTDLEDDDNKYLKAGLKMGVCMLISNLFVNIHERRKGTLVQISDFSMELADPQIFTKNIKDILKPYRIIHCQGVDPDG